MTKKEVPIWSVATGNVDITMKASTDAVDFVADQPGFVGVHPHYPDGTLWFFDSYKNAEKAMAAMHEAGIQTGYNICKFFVEERYLCQNPKKRKEPKFY